MKFVKNEEIEKIQKNENLGHQSNEDKSVVLIKISTNDIITNSKKKNEPCEELNPKRTIWDNHTKIL